MKITCDDIKEFMNKYVEVQLKQYKESVWGGRLIDCNGRFITLEDAHRGGLGVGRMRRVIIRLDSVTYIAEYEEPPEEEALIKAVRGLR
ncbi:hypothetical protein [Vulcanisaeta distributa]|uniref:hypothetical protein n=1 Tax=Vulcanisaeta distributa TaxID=164451 RepID=UPI0006D1B0A0|nr:hypothetical protein [Vulcanisaeta distributa]